MHFINFARKNRQIKFNKTLLKKNKIKLKFFQMICFKMIEDCQDLDDRRFNNHLRVETSNYYNLDDRRLQRDI
jgi:hypothetical protein